MKASRRVKLSEDVSIHPSSSSSTPPPPPSPPPPPTSASASTPPHPLPTSSSPPPSPPSMPSLSSSPSSSSSSSAPRPHPIPTLPSSPLPSTSPSSPAALKLSSSSASSSASSSTLPPQPLLSRSRSLSSSSSSSTTAVPDAAVPVLMRGKSEGGTSKVGRLERRRKISFSAESLLIAAIQDGDTDDLLRVLRCRPVDYSNNSSCDGGGGGGNGGGGGGGGNATAATTEYDQITKQLVNQTNHTGLTPLHHGVLTNNLDAVKILLTCGADVNAQDENGFTPLHTASACGFMQVVSLLILFGADVFLLTKEAELAVDVCKDIQVIRLLTQEMYVQIHSEIYVSAWLVQKVKEGWCILMQYLQRTWKYLHKMYLCYTSERSRKRN